MRIAVFLATSLSLAVACTSTDPATAPPAEDAGATPDAALAVPDAGGADGAVPAIDAGPGVAGVEVIVPPLAGAVAITVAPSDKPVDDTIVSKAYELSPNGATFEHDLDVCITTTKRVETKDACLAYYDDASSRWTCEDTCLQRRESSDTLCGKTNHFTSFAILLGGGTTSAVEGGCRSELVPPGGGAVAAPDGQAVATFLGGTLTKPTRVTITKRTLTGAELASPVYELTPSGAFPRDVEVCVRPDATLEGGSACLGFLDESVSPPKWKCEDRCLTRRGDHLCGSTSHFTSFAVLLGGGSASASCADAMIPVTGGTLTSLDGVASFVAEQGTFAQPTRVTIARAPSELRLGSDVFELLPDGDLAAKGKVCITPSPGADLKTACLGFKDATGAWKCEDTCLTAKGDGQLCGETSHFTSFAVLLGGGTGTSACQR